jgi:ferric hydroxamate transport system substrate-binding protein
MRATADESTKFAAPRVVALDWAGGAMALSLGVTPVGLADKELYRTWVAEPLLPSEVMDVGLRTEPDLELVAELKPNLILTNPLGAGSRMLLERIAPTYVIDLTTNNGDLIDQAERGLTQLGERLGRVTEAEAFIEDTRAYFTKLRQSLAKDQRPFVVIQFLDPRYVRVYSTKSIFGGALEQLGLHNAWDGAGNLWGFDLVGIEKLAAFPDADIVVVDPLPSGVNLSANPDSLWGNLPAVRGGRVVHLPPAWPFGESTAARRFAALLTNALSARHAG